MSDLHFGYEKNTLKCSCGRHFGCGEITPESRAAKAARMRDTMPSLMPEDMRQFLSEFELYHGRVRYRMEVVGTCTGEFNKAIKGQPLKGAVYDYSSDMAKVRAA